MFPREEIPRLIKHAKEVEMIAEPGGGEQGVTTQEDVASDEQTVGPTKGLVQEEHLHEYTIMFVSSFLM